MSESVLAEHPIRYLNWPGRLFHRQKAVQKGGTEEWKRKY